MLKIAGFGAWIPSVAPGGSDNFFLELILVLSGFLRNSLVFVSTVPRNRFKDALIDAVNQLAANGSEAGDPDFIFINPVSYQTLVKQLTSQGVYQMIKAKVNEDVSDFLAKALGASYGER